MNKSYIIKTHEVRRIDLRRIFLTKEKFDFNLYLYYI